MELSSLSLFAGISPGECSEMMALGCVRTAAFEKGAAIFHAGDRTEEFGVLLSGEVHVESCDLWGNRVILHNISAGHAFAETYALCGAPVMTDVTAAQASRVLFIRLAALLREENGSKPWYPKLLRNLALLFAHKNLAWSGRVLCLSAKGIRSRVMLYLTAQAARTGSTEFSIPFDRQQRADYLNVERSALSKELGRMQREGILSFHKNHFTLHSTRLPGR